MEFYETLVVPSTYYLDLRFQKILARYLKTVGESPIQAIQSNQVDMFLYLKSGNENVISYIII